MDEAAAFSFPGTNSKPVGAVLSPRDEEDVARKIACSGTMANAQVLSRDGKDNKVESRVAGGGAFSM